MDLLDETEALELIELDSEATLLGSGFLEKASKQIEAMQ